jgi:hypothetical protein
MQIAYADATAQQRPASPPCLDFRYHRHYRETFYPASTFSANDRPHLDITFGRVFDFAGRVCGALRRHAWTLSQAVSAHEELRTPTSLRALTPMREENGLRRHSRCFTQASTRFRRRPSPQTLPLRAARRRLHHTDETSPTQIKNTHVLSAGCAQAKNIFWGVETTTYIGADALMQVLH